MFIYGTAGRNAPYAIKILTQMQLCKLLTNNFKSLNKKAVFITLAFINFGDSSNQ
jgi:hypothetical protein